MNFDKVLESIKSIKLSGGVFGKTTILLVVLAVCVTAVSIKIGTWWFSLLLMVPMMAMAFYALKRVLDFAEKNPQAAIMDGAELLIHEKIVHGMKGEGDFEPVPALDHEPPPIDAEQLDVEDTPPSLLPEGDR